MKEEIFHILADNGYCGVKKINENSCGSVFVFENKADRVIKLTKDKGEANASAVLKGKNYAHIVKIFEVVKIKRYQKYVVEQERLIPLTRTTKLESFLCSKQIEKINQQYFDTFFSCSWFNLITQMFSGNQNVDEINLFWEKVKSDNLYKKNKRIENFIEAMIAAAKNLNKNEIYWHDFDLLNVMMDEKCEFKIIDLGYSTLLNNKKITHQEIERKK